MGHLTLMSEDVISALEHYPPDLRVLIGQCAPVPEWEEYVTGRYSETKQKDSSLLGGGKPVVAPGITRLGGQWKVDETEATPAASAAGPRTPEDAPEPRGEFKRATGSRPTREGSADFGPAPFQDDEDDEENESPQVGSMRLVVKLELIHRIQFNRYLAQEMKTTHQFDDNSDDDEDEGGGWLTRSSFGISSSSIARSTAREQALEFDVGPISHA
jgi:serine/threonine-protein phosphatase 6 regulatory subunit 3